MREGCSTLLMAFMCSGALHCCAIRYGAYCKSLALELKPRQRSSTSIEVSTVITTYVIFCQYLVEFAALEVSMSLEYLWCTYHPCVQEELQKIVVGLGQANFCC